jgi:hypothetical protein
VKPDLVALRVPNILQTGLNWRKIFWEVGGIYRVVVWDADIEEEREASIFGDSSHIPNADTLPPIGHGQSPIGLRYI